jgi:hypothetical protein
MLSRLLIYLYLLHSKVHFDSAIPLLRAMFVCKFSSIWPLSLLTYHDGRRSIIHLSVLLSRAYSDVVNYGYP